MMSDENSRAAAAPEYRSRTTALTMTMAPAPARPCTNRNASSTTTLGASEHSTEAAAYVISAASNGTRRPKRSLSGPITNWPRARPVTHAVNVSCTTESLASNSRASSGNAGRYMSIDSGPIAITDPRTITSPTVDELKRGRLRWNTESAMMTARRRIRSEARAGRPRSSRGTPRSEAPTGPVR